MAGYGQGRILYLLCMTYLYGGLPYGKARLYGGSTKPALTLFTLALWQATAAISIVLQKKTQERGTKGRVTLRARIG